MYDFLSDYFEVTIIAPDPKNFNNQKLNDRNVIYFKYRYGNIYDYISRIKIEFWALFNKEARFFKKNALFVSDFFFMFKFIKRYIQKQNPDHIIAVDSKNLLFCQLIKRKATMLSLEIIENDQYHKHCNLNEIDSVIIQSGERYKYLFNGNQLNTFYIQNAPIYQRLSAPEIRRGLIYCGTAWDAFGFYHCLEYLKAFPNEVMTVKGAILTNDKEKVEKEYEYLLKQNRLILDDNYIDEKSIVSFLAGFRIGFCFYNFDIPAINTFNYHSAPSGKLFRYLAAGVPVVGIDVSGLRVVHDFDCGVLIRELTPYAIRRAIEKIENNFEHYSKNCLKAAEYFSFDKTVQPFIDYLLRTRN